MKHFSEVLVWSNDMNRLAGTVCMAAILFLGAKPQHNLLSKYKVVEAYEVRPGVLAIPRYSDDGQICEIGLEGLHYSPEALRLDSGLSRQEVDQLADEFAPSTERGPQIWTPGGKNGMTVVEGNSMTTVVEYTNVSIQLFSDASCSSNCGYNSAVIIWKNRKCQKPRSGAPRS
jgi:hypothetical protein